MGILLGTVRLVGKLRALYYKRLLKKVGKNFFVGKHCKITGADNITVGDNIEIKDFSELRGIGGLVIEDNVIIATGVKILTQSHNFMDTSLPIKDQGSTNKPILIKSGSWLGANCIILPGTTIGKNCVIGAGCVVSGNIADFSVVSTQPPRIVKLFTSKEPRKD